MIEIPPQLFALGKLMKTPKASELLQMDGISAWTLLFAHGSGGWVTDEDREQFDHAVENKFEIVSFHALKSGARIAVRTNDGHAETIIMLEEEVP